MMRSALLETSLCACERGSLGGEERQLSEVRGTWDVDQVFFWDRDWVLVRGAGA